MFRVFGMWINGGQMGKNWSRVSVLTGICRRKGLVFSEIQVLLNLEKCIGIFQGDVNVESLHVKKVKNLFYSI